jgi:hypothetical protein
MSNKKHKTFRHSGDLGDIIFALPTIKTMGGGVLYLDPKGGGDLEGMAMPAAGKTKLSSEGIENIKELLESQEYVVEVKEWDGEEVDVQLDNFRKHIEYNNLAYSHLEAQDITHTKADAEWLKVEDNDFELPEGRTIVISRNLRYQGNHAFWEMNSEGLEDDAVFVGSPYEHEVFQKVFGIEVPYIETPTGLDLLKVIDTARVFISNQGFPHALAEGMKKKLICEVDKTYPAACWRREDATYV